MRLRYILFASTVISILYHFMPKHAREIMIDFVTHENYQISTKKEDIPKFALDYLIEIIDSTEFKILESEYKKEMKVKDSIEYLEYKKAEAEYLRVQDSITQAETKGIKSIKNGQFIISRRSSHRNSYSVPYYNSPLEEPFSINKRILTLALYNESTCLLMYNNNSIDFLQKKDDTKVKYVRYDLQDTLKTVNSIKDFFTNENASYTVSYNSFE